MEQRDIKLVNILINRTKEGQIDWKKTAVPDQFTSSIKGKNSVFIDKSIGAPDEPAPYWLSIMKPDGKKVVLITNVHYNGVEELYEVAQRRAYKVDDIIDDLFDDLKTSEQG